MNWKSLSWKIVVLIIIGAVVFVWLVKAPIMSWYLTKKMGVPVSMTSISMWPSQTVIHNFKLKNPHGFKIRNALKAEKTTIDYDFKGLVGNPSHIKEIHVEDIFMSIEFTNALGSSNNWTAIGAGMPADDSKHPSDHEVDIDLIVLTNLNVEIRGGQLLKIPPSKHIDHLEFHNVNSKTGFPTKELIKAIFQGAGIEQYIKNMFNPTTPLKQWVPGLFGDKEEVPVE